MLLLQIKASKNIPPEVGLEKYTSQVILVKLVVAGNSLDLKKKW